MVKTMSKIQVLQDPGFLYDLNFIFYLKFNMEAFIEDITDKSKKEENTAYFKGAIAEFGEISDDLYVFYHANQSGRCFMTTYYLMPFVKQNPSEIDLNFIQSKLNDQKQLLRNLISFYFNNLPNEDIEDCISSPSKLFNIVKKSNLSGEEKSKLYEFFMDPAPYIQTLHYEIISKSLLLSDYYKDNYKKILDANNNLDIEIIQTQMKGLKDLNFLNSENQILYISFCLINKHLINSLPFDNGLLYILGYDYTSVLDIAKKRNQKPNLQGLGISLCEESRVKILEMIAERGEITCKDLEREFNFSGSTSYHHITIMTKAGILKTRNEGKTILYSVNKKYFLDIIDTLNNLLNL